MFLRVSCSVAVKLWIWVDQCIFRVALLTFSLPNKLSLESIDPNPICFSCRDAQVFHTRWCWCRRFLYLSTTVSHNISHYFNICNFLQLNTAVHIFSPAFAASIWALISRTLDAMSHSIHHSHWVRDPSIPAATVVGVEPLYNQCKHRIFRSNRDDWDCCWQFCPFFFITIAVLPQVSHRICCLFHQCCQGRGVMSWRLVVCCPFGAPVEDRLPDSPEFFWKPGDFPANMQKNIAYWYNVIIYHTNPGGMKS